MSKTYELPDTDTWITVAALAKAEKTTASQIYHALNNKKGSRMAHSKVGNRIRVRRRDWDEWHKAHMVTDSQIDLPPV